MLGVGTNEGGEKLFPIQVLSSASVEDTTSIMSEVDIKISRTPSPRQMDALPPGALTPKKNHGSLLRPVLVDGDVSLPSDVILPHFVDTPEVEWIPLFTQKIQQCSKICDFTTLLTNSNEKAKQIKSAALSDILWMVNEHGSWLTDQQYGEIYGMFSRNVLRPLPPPSTLLGEAFDPEDEDPVYDPSWPHLQLTYEVFTRLLESPSFNPNIAKKYTDQLFVHRLLSLFDVEDGRERESVKTVVHRVYGKFLHLRAFIRKEMRNVFAGYVFGGEYHNVGEMLEILGSVINGFAVPLREEHKSFLLKSILPLHRHPHISVYFPQLTLCVVQFAEKDPSLVTRIVNSLLHVWPKTNSIKEILFLNEIEEILDVAPAENFEPIVQPLALRLAQCIASPHFQVAERALQYWSNEYIVNLFTPHMDQVMPAVLPFLLKRAQGHWNKNVQLQVYNVLRLFMDLNPRLYELVSTQKTNSKDQTNLLLLDSSKERFKGESKEAESTLTIAQSTTKQERDSNAL